MSFRLSLPLKVGFTAAGLDSTFSSSLFSLGPLAADPRFTKALPPSAAVRFSLFDFFSFFFTLPSSSRSSRPSLKSAPSFPAFGFLLNEGLPANCIWSAPFFTVLPLP